MPLSLKNAVERSTLRDENPRLREQAPGPEVMTAGAWFGRAQQADAVAVGQPDVEQKHVGAGRAGV